MSTTENFLKNYELTGKNLKVFTYPARILLKKADPIKTFDDELRQLCRNMLYTMYKAPGIGLAAPQVGLSIRLFVLDVDYQREKVTKPDDSIEYRLSDFNPRVFINPKIISKEGEITYEEGCLSVPGIYEEVKRSKKISVEYQDMFGEAHTLTVEDLAAICIQHENDHLDGIVFLERLSLIKKKLLKKKYLKQKEKDEK